MSNILNFQIDLNTILGRRLITAISATVAEYEGRTTGAKPEAEKTKQTKATKPAAPKADTSEESAEDKPVPKRGRPRKKATEAPKTDNSKAASPKATEREPISRETGDEILALVSAARTRDDNPVSSATIKAWLAKKGHDSIFVIYNDELEDFKALLAGG